MEAVKQNRNLFVIAVIAVVNALGYGIIIPVLYSYSHKFGLNDFQNGLLFSMYSVFQFLSTPVIGRLSDKYGRKPLLILSLMGTVASFLLMAFAKNPFMLFLARAVDGVTAGNIPVAQAVISDTTKPRERARGFGIIGAAFGFGFVFGPTISALTFQHSNEAPFLIAAGISLLAVILTVILLPETNKHKGLTRHEAMFDFSRMVGALFNENIGLTLLISLLYAFAFSMFIYGNQPLSVEIIHMSPTQISVNFTVFGLIGLLAQAFIIPFFTKRFHEKRILSGSLVMSAATFVAFYFTRSFPVLIAVSVFYSLANSFINPLIQSLLSKEVDAHSQGSIMGLNTSYMSIGLIIGPIVGGLLATIQIPLPFLLGALLAGICWYVSVHILRRHTGALGV